MFIYPIGDPEVLTEDFVLFYVLEEDWRDWDASDSVHLRGDPYAFLSDMPGVVLAFLEVSWLGQKTGRSWPALVRYDIGGGEYVLRRARSHEVIPSRYKGGF